MQTNNEMRKVYKLGKSIKGIGSWMLWGNILIPIFTIIVLIFGTLSFSYDVVQISAFLMLGFIVAIGIFQILIVIYTIIMIARGFTTASATGVKKYTVFSILYLLSYLITAIMLGILLYLVYTQINGIISSLQSIFSNLSSAISDPTQFINYLLISLMNIISKLGHIIRIPFIGAFVGYIIRIIAWGFLKGGIKRTSDFGMVKRASSRCILMMVSLIFLCIFNVIIFLAIVFSVHLGTINLGKSLGNINIAFIIMLFLSLPYFIFYILEVSAFISIGKRLKTGYSKKEGYQAQLNEPTLSGHPNQYSPYGNSPYGNPNRQQGYNPNQQPQYSSQQGYNNNPNPYGNPNIPPQYSSQSNNNFGAKSTDSTIFCPECGSPNSKTDRICKFCGRPLHN